MDSHKKIKEINNLIEFISENKNRYYITNICILIVEHTFEIKKHVNQKDIRVMKIYDICIEVLNSLKSKNKQEIKTKEKIFELYKLELELF